MNNWSERAGKSIPGQERDDARLDQKESSGTLQAVNTAKNKGRRNSYSASSRYLESQNPYASPSFASSSEPPRLCPLLGTPSLPLLCSTPEHFETSSKLPKAPIGSSALSVPSPPARGPAPSGLRSSFRSPAARGGGAQTWLYCGRAVEQQEEASLSRRPTALWDRGRFLRLGRDFRVPMPRLLSSTEAERVCGQPWRRTLRSGCTRSSLRWFR